MSKSTTTQRGTPDDQAVVDLPGAAARALPLVRSHLCALNGATIDLVSGSEALRRLQFAAAQETQQRHEECQRKLRAASDAPALGAAVTDAAIGDFEAAARYWQDVARICNATGANVMGRLGAGLDGGPAGPQMPEMLWPQWNALSNWMGSVAPPLP